jgi:hypothetical protein
LLLLEVLGAAGDLVLLAMLETVAMVGFTGAQAGEGAQGLIVLETQALAGMEQTALLLLQPTSKHEIRYC